MMMAKIKETIEKATNTTAKDVVISVPSYFTAFQRKAVIDAAGIAGLNCLRVMNDTTASALAWGIYKEFDENEATPVLIYDIGDASTTVALAAFTKAKLKILAHAYDRTLGGRNFHRLLVDHFIQQFKSKYRIDASTNARAKARLDQACEKVKTILSANAQAPINVDSLMEDRDVSGMVTREEFEKMCQPLFDRVAAPAKQALATAGIDISKVHAVELVGGGSRMPQIASILKETLGKDISRTLNAEEVVAKGCALQCAILSPVVRVKEFKVEDVAAYPINLVWRDTSSDAMETEEPTLIFAEGTTVPALKVITFPKGKPFEMRASYAPSAKLPPGTDPYIGTWTIASVPATESGEPGKIRVKVRLDLNDIFNVESAELIETLPAEQPAGETAAATPATPQTPPATPPVAAEGAPAATEKKEEPKVRTRRTPLTLTSTPIGLSASVIQQAGEAERNRIAKDLDVKETAEKKNALESYVYETRSALGYDLAPYMVDAEREQFLAQLGNTADWLYGEGEHADKATYTARLAELKKIGDPVFKRKREDEDRPHVLQSLKSAIEQYTALADSTDPRYEHIPKEERDRVKQRVQSAADAVFAKAEESNKAEKYKDPLIWTSDIAHWKENLDSFVPLIMNKPKPAPKPEPKKEEPKKEEEPKTEGQSQPAEPMSTDGAAPEAAKPAGMDVD
jgi:heat shock protein 4